MFARKVYNRLLLSIILYSSGILDIMFYYTTPKILITVSLLTWSIIPVFAGHKETTSTPFLGSSASYNVLRLFIIWQILVLLRGIFFNYGIIGSIGQMGNQYSIFAFLMPLIIFLNPRQFNFNLFVKILMFVGIIFLIYIWMNREHFYNTDIINADVMMLSDDDIEKQGNWLKGLMYSSQVFMMMGFLLFIPAYIDKKRYLFVIICWAIALFSCIIAGRRGTSSTLIIMGLISFYFYVNKSKKSGKTFRYLIILAGVLSIAYYLYSSFTSMFSFMANRIGGDSRSGLIAMFWNDMGSGLDWIWGRGTGGEYYCPMIQGDTMVYYRNAIESGILFIILSGGVISLILYVSVLLRAAIKGFFHTRNQLTKAFAAYIGVSLYNLIPFGLPECSVTFFVVWVGAAICSSPYYRNMTDSEVKQLFR